MLRFLSRSGVPLLAALALALIAVSPALAHRPDHGQPPVFMMDLTPSTQGPLWPPADVTDANGDFPVVGIQLVDVGGEPGFPVFGQAMLVSRHTVPPLDENGNRVLNNWFLASYDFVRTLDLGPGGADRDMVLYALSMGPPDESGVPRIPRQGDSDWNLFTGDYPCKEIFPNPVQRATYTRPRYPLHQVPIWGFQGDQIAYDIESGNPFTPISKGGVACPSGCPGEDVIDSRPRTQPITLGEWLRAEGKLKVTLTDWDHSRHAYTAAIFDFQLRRMIPDSIYTVWTIRTRRIPGGDFTPQADPIAIPSVIVTNFRGHANASFKVPNPFPDWDTDFDLQRIFGVVVAWHSDYQNWGACGGLLGNGVEIHTHLNSVALGQEVAPDFVTVAPAP